MACSSLLSSLLLFLSLFSLLPLSLSQQTQLNSEKQILLQINHDWGSPAALASWSNSTSGSYCNWTGVTCSADGSVTQLMLSGENITGHVPSSICQLKSLFHLDLSYNSITGMFPRLLSNCTNLQYLNLSHNLFIGEFPSDIGRVLPNVTYFGVSGNTFSGEIPTGIGKMTQLQSLRLDNNLFNGTIPQIISNLTELQELALAWNSFSPGQIPEEYGNLAKLTSLFMASANLEGKIPNSFTKLTQLVLFDLSQNRLQGTIPTGIWSFSKLKYLCLYQNNLSGEITINNPLGAESLVKIDLSTNQLTGSIPESFGTLQNLSVLYLYSNKISGEIPESIGRLPKLTDFQLYNNSLTGILPPELGKHSLLRYVQVFSNMLSGEIPENICYNGAIIHLVVSMNNMTGSIPQSIVNCSHLNRLQVHTNRFTGNLPAGFWQMQDLDRIIMNNNMLSGELPSRLPLNLTRLELVNNQFSGSIPGYSSRISVFKAGGNNFTGDIPFGLSAGMPQLQTLDLSENSISGEIPASIGSLRSLSTLILSRNKISGEIPATIGSMPVLTTLDLSSNELSGEIPSALGNVTFSFLNLSSNNLSGEIPSGIDSQAYHESFLSNPGLCSSVSINGVSMCRAESGGSGGISHGLLILFIVLGVIILVIIMVFALCVMRNNRRRKDVSVPAMWKITPFHRLDFTENAIFHGMTEENLIGAGGAGQVYRVALGTSANEIVAVKRIYNKDILSLRLEHEFETEVNIMGSIRHINIVKLLCYISSPDTKLLVYEFMENGSLDWWLHETRRGSLGPAKMPTGPLDWSIRLQIAIGAARGLCYMHHESIRPIVHRDIKSSNILLDSEFNARIGDFGLARTLMMPDGSETESVVAGSIGYMAPECGFARKLNEKVDVYSFGVVLLELTTGREAHDGGDYGSLAEWAWRNVQQESTIYSCLEEALRESPYLDDIEVVFKLGMICTGTLPSTRPNMRHVLDVLLNMSLENKHKNDGHVRTSVV